MEFDELLEQVTALLRRQRRVSYLAIKKRFGAADDDVEALKAELVDAQRLARDENDRVLVWDEDAGTELPVAVEEIAAAVRDDAERRQLTVMFCDLVGSTALATELDPEDLRALVRRYQHSVAEIVAREHGHIAQYLGDGVLVYFGFPHAHEDDARRAVRTALAVVAAVSGLRDSRDRPIAVRVGIHTGTVVIGEVGGGEHRERLALGETPNVAARLQGIARPNSVVISGTTLMLLEGMFSCREMGVRELRGVADPVEAFEVLEDTGVRSRFDLAAGYVLLPLVGRRAERDALVELWDRARSGRGQAALISAEAGFGKSRLVQAIKHHVSGEGLRWGSMRCSPYYRNSMLRPVIELWEQNLRWDEAGDDEERCRRLRKSLEEYRVDVDAAHALLAPLFSLPQPGHPVLKQSAEGQRQQLLHVLHEVIVALAFEPVLIVFEDVQWIDPTTLDLLRLLVERIDTQPMLVIITCRPEFDPARLAPAPVRRFELGRLSDAETNEMIRHITGGRELPGPVREQIVDRSDGVPLFIEESTRMVLSAPWLEAEGGRLALRGELPPLGVPASLQDSLMARLDRLGDSKPVAQLAATVGRWFTFELLQAVAPQEPRELEVELARLVSAGVLRQRGMPPDASYQFQQPMLQETARQSLLKRTRQDYHRRLAEALESRFPATSRNRPELVAYHFSEAGEAGRALGYWQWAGELAVQRSANTEALAHFGRALELLPSLPASAERDQRELTVLLASSVPAVAQYGWAADEVQRLYDRAHRLLHAGNSGQQFGTMVGSCTLHMLRADMDAAAALAEELMQRARRWDVGSYFLAARILAGGVSFYRGRLAEARAHLEEALELYDEHDQNAAFVYGQDPGVVSRAWLASTLWLLGEEEAARAGSRDAVALARQLGHPFSLVYALVWHGRLLELAGEGEELGAIADEVLGRSSEQGFALFHAAGLLLRGSAAREAEDHAAAGDHYERGILAWERTGARAMVPYFLTLRARSECAGGRRDRARPLLDEALWRIGASGERWWEAEVLRLRGELDDGAARQQARADLTAALELAEGQQARRLVERAGASLVRSLHQGGDAAAARTLRERLQLTA